MSDEEDEIWGGLEDLWREGKINHVPSEDPDEEGGFTLTEHGNAAARDLLRENDDAVIMLLSVHIEEHVDKKGDPKRVAEALTEIAEWIRDDAGVNAFRVLKRNPEKAPGINVEGFSEAFLSQFDPDEEDDE